MDRDRFRKRATDLRNCADLVGRLTEIPDRATQKDFHQAANLMAGAANDLEELVKGSLPGCICRRIQDENYDYLNYAEGCRHHGQLYVMREGLKANYAKMESALKNEVRMKLVAAALAGTAGLSSGDDRDEDHLAKRAIAIADEAICRIAREDA